MSPWKFDPIGSVKIELGIVPSEFWYFDLVTKASRVEVSKFHIYSGAPLSDLDRVYRAFPANRHLIYYNDMGLPSHISLLKDTNLSMVGSKADTTVFTFPDSLRNLGNIEVPIEGYEEYYTGKLNFGYNENQMLTKLDLDFEFNGVSYKKYNQHIQYSGNLAQIIHEHSKVEYHYEEGLLKKVCETYKDGRIEQRLFFRNDKNKLITIKEYSNYHYSDIEEESNFDLLDDLELHFVSSYNHRTLVNGDVQVGVNVEDILENEEKKREIVIDENNYVLFHRFFNKVGELSHFFEYCYEKDKHNNWIKVERLYHTLHNGEVVISTKQLNVSRKIYY